MKTDTPGHLARIERRRAAREVGKQLESASFNERVDRWLDMIAIEGKSWKEAAKACRFSTPTARALLGNPAVLRRMRERVEILREHERPNNLALARKVRDDGLKPGASAAEKKVALEAAKFLEGQPDSGAQITIAGGQNVIAGYVIKLDGPAEGPRVIAPYRPAKAAEDV